MYKNKVLLKTKGSEMLAFADIEYMFEAPKLIFALGPQISLDGLGTTRPENGGHLPLGGQCNKCHMQVQSNF